MKFRSPFVFNRKAARDENRSMNVDYTTGVGLPYSSLTTPQGITSALQLSAVYRCVDVISDAIASQTIDILQYSDASGWSANPFHKHHYMLNYEPSPSMNRFSMMKTMICKVLLEGNGLIQIFRDSFGEPYKLKLINDPFKMFQRFDDSIYYQIGFGAGNYVVEGEDMIHILNFSYNGMIGVSTLQYAMNSTDLAKASESSAEGFFASGANMSGILESQGKLTEEKAKKIKASWAAAFSPETGTPGGIAVMETGLKFTPVTVNPKDAQMLETRKFNVVEICRFFGVTPAKVFDGSNLTYSNIESFQLGFLTDTISPWDVKIETEINRKLFRPSQRRNTRINFNLDDLLRANLDTKANYTSKLFQCGGLTVNEVRKVAGTPRIEGADDAYIQVNMQKVLKPAKIENPLP